MAAVTICSDLGAQINKVWTIMLNVTFTIKLILIKLLLYLGVYCQVGFTTWPLVKGLLTTALLLLTL